MVMLFAIALALAPSMARRLSLADNLRLIFLDRGPLMGLGVELGALLAPPPPMEVAASVDEARPEGRLDIDWRGRDVLLISVDALRADHVGAYGYARPTSPHIDALAREGALFLRAYCPTPHTSYSVTSMMTGKNLRPLIVQGLGKDSDTFAGILRTYGYRTAAFYPPAVFFIDQELFASFEERHLDFEYARVEFSDPRERAHRGRGVPRHATGAIATCFCGCTSSSRTSPTSLTPSTRSAIETSIATTARSPRPTKGSARSWAPCARAGPTRWSWSDRRSR